MHFAKNLQNIRKRPKTSKKARKCPKVLEMSETSRNFKKFRKFSSEGHAAPILRGECGAAAPPPRCCRSRAADAAAPRPPLRPRRSRRRCRRRGRRLLVAEISLSAYSDHRIQRSPTRRIQRSPTRRRAEARGLPRQTRRRVIAKKQMAQHHLVTNCDLECAAEILLGHSFAMVPY